MTFFLVIFAVACLALLAWVIYKMEEVDELKDELDKYSVHLDERANKLALWENLLNERNRDEEGKRNATDDGQLVP